jgi:hypothetical protein
MELKKGSPSHLITDDFKLDLSGLLLILVGTAFAEISYFIGEPIAYPAVGISSIILGAVIMLMPRRLVPKGIILQMIGESYANGEAVLLHFLPSGGCRYMPPSDGRSFIQIHTEGEHTGVNINLPLTLETLSKIPDKNNKQKALNYVVRDHFELIKSLKVRESDGQILVQLNGYREKNDFPITKKIIGSEPTCITGGVLSFLLNKPLTLVKEEYSKIGIAATFKLLVNSSDVES